MIQEYMFSNHEKYDEIKAKYSNQDGFSEKILNESVWLAIFSVKENDRDSAKNLSEIHEEIMKYNPIVLECGCSEYFNRILYPLVNTFERLLRKYLYLKVQLSAPNISNDSITKLEEKDFGTIFSILFVDDQYAQSVKKEVTNNVKFLSKKRLINISNSFNEKLLWDDIAQGQVELLKTNYDLVQLYRNHVMHAHNIDYQTFISAEKLFKSINKQLNQSIVELDGINVEVAAAALLQLIDAVNATVNGETLMFNSEGSLTELIKALTMQADLENRL